MSKIKALIINEGITCGRIIFYLAFIVEKKKKMIITFKVTNCFYSRLFSYIGSETKTRSSSHGVSWDKYVGHSVGENRNLFDYRLLSCCRFYFFCDIC
jgi:hypothetical protein